MATRMAASTAGAMLRRLTATLSNASRTRLPHAAVADATTAEHLAATSVAMPSGEAGIYGSWSAFKAAEAGAAVCDAPLAECARSRAPRCKHAHQGRWRGARRASDDASSLGERGQAQLQASRVPFCAVAGGG